MRHSTARALLSAAVAASILLAHGCGGAKTAIGAKPAIYTSQMADQSQTVDELRAWLQSLRADDARKLEETGAVAFGYQDLSASDPTHAQVVDRYVKSLEAGLAGQMQAVGKPAPSFSVQTVSFTRQGRGAYHFEVRWAPNGGTRLALSDPL